MGVEERGAAGSGAGGRWVREPLGRFPAVVFRRLRDHVHPGRGGARLHPQHRHRDLHHRGQRVSSERGIPFGVGAGVVDRQQAAGGGWLRRRRGQLRLQPRQHPGFVQAVLQKLLHRQGERRQLQCAVGAGQVSASDRADLLRLETEPYRQYRLQVFFKDEAGGSVPISTGGSAWISFYEPDRDRYAGLSPGDHNRDDGVTILHFLTGLGDEYYIEINDYDIYNGDRSADYHGKYHVELTDVTQVSRLANNLSVTPTGSRMHRTVGQNSWAQEFRTGDHTAGYKIDRIQLFIEAVHAGDNPVVKIVSNHVVTDVDPNTDTDDYAEPGSLVCAFAPLEGYASGILDDDRDVLDTLYPKNSDNVVLTATTTYWLQISEASGTSARSFKSRGLPATTSSLVPSKAWLIHINQSSRDETASTPAWSITHSLSQHTLFQLWGSCVGLDKCPRQ